MTDENQLFLIGEDEDLLNEALDQIDLDENEHLLNEPWDLLDDEYDPSIGDTWSTDLVDPLEERATSIRNGEHQYMSTLSHFTSILAKTGISGPRHLQLYNLKARAAKIGTGAQFTVFREYSGFLGNEGLVIKRVNIPLSRDDNVSFASGEDYRIQLRTLELEVRSLCHPVLRNHRNIVHLVAWGYDYPLPDTPVPVLFMESALMTLTDFLKVDNEELLGNNETTIKYHLALDIISGIQALHSLNIVHGDIKPDNVLVFKETGNSKTSFVAKISDFGVCVDLEVPGNEFTIDDYRGTPGWVAPEIADISRWKDDFKPTVMLRFDSFSLGLTLLSIFIKREQPVELQHNGERPVDVAIARLGEDRSLSSELRMMVSRALRALLAEDPWSRALPSPELLKGNNSAYASWLSASQTGRTSTRHVGTTDQMYNKGPNFWRRLDRSVTQELEEQYRVSQNSFESDVLFGLAQSITRSRAFHVDSVLEYVAKSAKGGFSPARAVYAQLMHAHRRKPEFDEDTLNEWNLQAISEGYLFFTPSPAADRNRLELAKQKFRDAGGYATDPFLRKQDILATARNAEKATAWIKEKRVVDNKGNTLLHIAANLGLQVVLKHLIEEGMMAIDVQNDNLETPLYKAFQAGHVDVIEFLLAKGADPSISTKHENLTALHWLWTLPEDRIQGIATRMARGGAVINAPVITAVAENSGGSPQRIQMLHFPHEFPLGTPLHWAAFARNLTAMQVLLDLGADINATYHGFDIGSSPLFLAVWYGELNVARFLLSRGAEATVQDPKGRNLFHYMSFYLPDYHGSLAHSWHYWIRHGNWDEHLRQTSEIAKLLNDASVEIDAESKVPRRTSPIRMASEEWDGGVTMALSELGADAVAGRERTVLHLWAYIRGSELAYPESYPIIFQSISKGMQNIDIPSEYEGDTPLQALSAKKNEDEEVERIADIMFAHKSPPDINATNRRGWTALYYALFTERDPTRRAMYLINRGANVTIQTTDGRTIFFPITYNIHISDQESHNLIFEILSHLLRIEPSLGHIRQAYQKYFLPAPGNMLTLSEAAKGGRIRTLTLLLDMGIGRNINNIIETRPTLTILDRALIRAGTRRRAHIESLASYTSEPARQRAIAAGSVYGESDGKPGSAAEAYWGSPKVLHLLRSRGAKRACELELLTRAEASAVLEVYERYRSHPDLWDVMDMYWIGFAPENQPNKEDWTILYELSRMPDDWRDQLVRVLHMLYDEGTWRPDLTMLEAAAKAHVQECKKPSRSEVLEVPDSELLRKILIMLASVEEADTSMISADAADEKRVWIEARDTLCFGPNGFHNTLPGHILQVELVGDNRLGGTRRLKEDE